MTEKLPTINLKGKEYVQVKDRIAYFNVHHPKGQIITEVLNSNAHMVTFKATVWPDSSQASRHFTAHSFGTVDEVKAFEKLETVAIGRCLALMGIGIIESIASADEMTRFHDKEATLDASRQVKNTRSTATTKKEGAINLEQGDKLATGIRKTGKDIGKPWYAIDRANGNRVWITPDQYDYLSNFTTSEVPHPTAPPPSADDLVDLPL